jgi:hypothetical protein
MFCFTQRRKGAKTRRGCARGEPLLSSKVAARRSEVEQGGFAANPNLFVSLRLCVTKNADTPASAVPARMSGRVVLSPRFA